MSLDCTVIRVELIFLASLVLLLSLCIPCDLTAYSLFLLISCLSSSLFPDVVNCMQTDNLELKKLVYLYLMNYAKSQPDMAIMAVNSFVKVTCSHSSSESSSAQ